MSRLTIYDVDYQLSVSGSGTPLVLLHGFTGRGANWQPVMPTLAQAHTVITVDLLGHGETSAPDDPQRYRMPEAAHDLAVLFKALSATPVHLLGYSMGGRLALYTALHYPELIASLILESASPGLRTEGEREARRESDHALAAFIEREGVPAFVDRWEALPLFATQRALPEARQKALRAQRLQNRAHGLANSLRGMGTGEQPPLWDALSQLTMPVTLITGEQDTKFVQIAREMQSHLREAEHVIIPEAGHTTHLEQPALFVKAVEDALQTQRRHRLQPPAHLPAPK
ncbi:MAG: 2-succinyl-6-hydroxy-2,4-cyclohexadiene-1-carboxy late synthase [Anaerolineae bacterium]